VTEAHDGVEGRADLMTHVGEELRLHLRRRDGGLACSDEVRPDLVVGGHISHDALDGDGRAVLAADEPHIALDDDGAAVGPLERRLVALNLAFCEELVAEPMPLLGVGEDVVRHALAAEVALAGVSQHPHHRRVNEQDRALDRREDVRVLHRLKDDLELLLVRPERRPRAARPPGAGEKRRREEEAAEQRHRDPEGPRAIADELVGLDLPDELRAELG
jgi:hypothetical protein